MVNANRVMWVLIAIQTFLVGIGSLGLSSTALAHNVSFQGGGYYYHIIHDNETVFFFRPVYRNSFKDAANELADLCRSKNWTQYTQRTYGPYTDKPGADRVIIDAKRQWVNSGFSIGNDQ